LPEDFSIIRRSGHAIEARLCAEDPENGFLPSIGRIHALRFPEMAGLRIDCGVAEGSEVTPHYDSMIAKLIAHAQTRDAAIDLLRRALGEVIVAGPRTNARFLQNLLDHPAFRACSLDTGLIERNLDALGAIAQPPDLEAITEGARVLLAGEKADCERIAHARSGWAEDPWSLADGFSLGIPREHPFRVRVGERVHELRFDAAAELPLGEENAAPRMFTHVETAFGIYVFDRGRELLVEPFDPLSVSIDSDAEGADGAVIAPMHGRLTALFVAEGEAVLKGARLAILEAMKMEHIVAAPHAGRVEGLAHEAGAQVEQGARLLRIVPEP
jgi:3-methylcrotonyl-CoA carboxylase alpha subunit